MRFNCDLTRAERDAKAREWHRWFAWHPVCTTAGYCWLEYVERRGEYIASYVDDWMWEYRAVEK